MKFLLTKLMICLALYTGAQTADPNAHSRVLSGSFSKISVSTGVQLYLTQGNENSVSVSVSDASLEENFKTEVVNGTLKIYYDVPRNKKFSLKNKQLKAYVTYKNLEAITTSAGSRTILTNTLTAGNLALSFSSGSSFKGNIKAGNLTTDASSGAEAIVSGSADKLNVTASSGSEFKGADLKVTYCNASAHSGGSIKIEVDKELTASAHSGGSIKYSGNALITKTDLHSGGSVRKI